MDIEKKSFFFRITSLALIQLVTSKTTHVISQERAQDIAYNCTQAAFEFMTSLENNGIEDEVVCKFAIVTFIEKIKHKKNSFDCLLVNINYAINEAKQFEKTFSNNNVWDEFNHRVHISAMDGYYKAFMGKENASLARMRRSSEYIANSLECFVTHQEEKLMSFYYKNLDL